MGSTWCVPQGVQRPYHSPSVFLSQWTFLEMRSSPRPLVRIALLTGFCVHKRSPFRAESQVTGQGLANLKSLEKAEASSLSPRRVTQPTRKARRACCLFLHCSCMTYPSRLHFPSEVFQRQHRIDNTTRNILPALTATCLNGLQLHSVASLATEAAQ